MQGRLWFHIDLISWPPTFSSPPEDGSPLLRGDAHLTLLRFMTEDIRGIFIVAEDLQGGDDRTFATVIGPHKDGQTTSWFDHRMPVRHEVFQLYPGDHSAFPQKWAVKEGSFQ